MKYSPQKSFEGIMDDVCIWNQRRVLSIVSNVWDDRSSSRAIDQFVLKESQENTRQGVTAGTYACCARLQGSEAAANRQAADAPLV